jgi:hypothetical protein
MTIVMPNENLLPDQEVVQIGMAIWIRVSDTRRVPDPMGMGTGTIFYLCVAPVPDPNRDWYRTGIFFHPQVTRRVPDILLPL